MSDFYISHNDLGNQSRFNFLGEVEELDFDNVPKDFVNNCGDDDYIEAGEEFFNITQRRFGTRPSDWNCLP